MHTEDGFRLMWLLFDLIVGQLSIVQARMGENVRNKWNSPYFELSLANKTAGRAKLFL